MQKSTKKKKENAPSFFLANIHYFFLNGKYIFNNNQVSAQDEQKPVNKDLQNKGAVCKHPLFLFHIHTAFTLPLIAGRSRRSHHSSSVPRSLSDVPPLCLTPQSRPAAIFLILIIKLQPNNIKIMMAVRTRRASDAKIWR
jgi:hypothetical protein